MILIVCRSTFVLQSRHEQAAISAMILSNLVPGLGNIVCTYIVRSILCPHTLCTYLKHPKYIMYNISIMVKILSIVLSEEKNVIFRNLYSCI